MSATTCSNGASRPRQEASTSVGTAPAISIPSSGAPGEPRRGQLGCEAARLLPIDGVDRIHDGPPPVRMLQGAAEPRHVRPQSAGRSLTRVAAGVRQQLRVFERIPDLGRSREDDRLRALGHRRHPIMCALARMPWLCSPGGVGLARSLPLAAVHRHVVGALVSNIGTWMETVALGYYVADTTGKASWSAIVGAQPASSRLPSSVRSVRRWRTG